MLGINFKKLAICTLWVFAISSILFATSSFAADGGSPIFGALIQKGGEIFTGMREIIFAVSGFGIIAVAIGGFFGNLNWKWLTAIAIGLFILSTTSAIITYMVGQAPGSFSDVQEAVHSGGE